MLFVIENIRFDDRGTFAKAEAFLQENPDVDVRQRPQEQLQRAVDKGQGLIVAQDDNICGLSLVYPFDIPPDGPMYSEIGTMRISSNGYALQVFLAKFHLFQIRIEEDEGQLPPVFAVAKPASVSARNLTERVGMSPWNPPDELRAARSAAGTPFSEHKLILAASQRSLMLAIQDLRNWHIEGNDFRSPKGDATIRINLGWFNAGLLELEF